jgi:hypothetical protein
MKQSQYIKRELCSELVSMQVNGYLKKNISSSKRHSKLSEKTNKDYKPLFVLLKELSLPFIPTYFRINKDTPKSRRSRFDWIKPIVKIKQAFNLQVLINFDITPELTNGNVNRIVFELPKPSNETELKKLKPRKHKLNIIDSDEDESDTEEEDDDDNKDRIEYITYIMTELLSTASSSFNLEEQESKIREGAETITKIEGQLKEVIFENFKKKSNFFLEIFR